MRNQATNMNKRQIALFSGGEAVEDLLYKSATSGRTKNFRYMGGLPRGNSTHLSVGLKLRSDRGRFFKTQPSSLF